MCNDCPEVNTLDASAIQNCEVVLDPEVTTLPPDDPENTTLLPEDPENTTLPPNPEDTTLEAEATTEFIDGTSTQTIPNLPPSITTQVPTAPPILPGHKYKDIIRQLVGSHQCFVVHRQGENFRLLECND